MWMFTASWPRARARRPAGCAWPSTGRGRPRRASWPPRGRGRRRLEGRRGWLGFLIETMEKKIVHPPLFVASPACRAPFAPPPSPSNLHPAPAWADQVAKRAPKRGAGRRGACGWVAARRGVAVGAGGRAPSALPRPAGPLVRLSAFHNGQRGGGGRRGGGARRRGAPGGYASAQLNSAASEQPRLSRRRSSRQDPPHPPMPRWMCRRPN